MANDAENENGLRYGFLKKHQDVRLKFAFKIDEIFAKMLLKCGISSRNCF